MELDLTKAAREKIADAAYCLEEGRLNKKIKDTSEARELIEKIGTPPLASID